MSARLQEEILMSTIITSENTFQEAATYGGLVDAIGGVATIILAIIALSGINQPMLGAIATIVFGAALLIQGGTMLTEYTKLIFPTGAVGPTDQVVGGGGVGLSALFLSARVASCWECFRSSTFTRKRWCPWPSSPLEPRCF
jgi:hypothetical protein